MKIALFDDRLPDVGEVLSSLDRIYKRKGIRFKIDHRKGILSLDEEDHNLKITLKPDYRDGLYNIHARARSRRAITPLGQRMAYFKTKGIHFLDLLEIRIDKILERFREVISFEKNKKQIIRPLKELDDSFVGRLASSVRFEVSTTSTSVFVQVFDGDQVIGLARAYGDEITMSEVVHTYHCSDDLIDISYEYPEVMDGEQIRLLEVNSVSLEKDYHGMGIGKQIYNHIIAGWKKQTRMPFVIIPEKCSVSGSTSKMALRVWKSLKREYPSSGYCVVIDL